jgi:hypothetical protein
MPLREKDREMHRRQRRRSKLKKLKTKLAETKDNKRKRALEEKLRKLQPWWRPKEETG